MSDMQQQEHHDGSTLDWSSTSRKASTDGSEGHNFEKHRKVKHKFEDKKVHDPHLEAPHAEPPRVLIVGCGIAGPALASFLLLGRQKARITILERSPYNQHGQGQNIDVRGAGLTIIRKLGLENDIRAATTGEVGVRIVDSQDRTWAALGADRSGQVETATSDVEILRGTLAAILLRRSEELSRQAASCGAELIEYCFGDHLSELTQEEDIVRVRFAKSDETREYDVVVGADGLQSPTRKLVFGGADEFKRIRDLHLFGAFFSMPAGLEASEWRRFYHAPGARAVMLRPAIQQQRTTAFFSLRDPGDERLALAAARGRQGIAEQKALIREYFADAGWKCRQIVQDMENAEDFWFDKIAQVKMDSLSKGRVVLLGDAGYCASPISGMGTTLALMGAYNLAGELTSCGGDFDAAFHRYQKQMQPTVDKAQAVSPSNRPIFYMRSKWSIWLFRLFGALVARSGLAKLLFKFAGPPARNAEVKDYGFAEHVEHTEQEKMP